MKNLIKADHNDCYGLWRRVCDYYFKANGKIVGGFRIKLVAMYELHISNFVIYTSHQGMGFGTAMMKELIELAQSMRAKVLSLYVLPSNERAIKLYQRANFVKVRRPARLSGLNRMKLVLVK